MAISPLDGWSIPAGRSAVAEVYPALWKHAYPQAYKNSVEQYSEDFGIPKEFIWSIMRAESHYKADAQSWVGAKGLMQLMPNTSRQVAKMLGDHNFNTNQLTRPEVNIRLGTRYLHRLGKKFNNTIPLMAAGYSLGGNVLLKYLGESGVDTPLLAAAAVDRAASETGKQSAAGRAPAFAGDLHDAPFCGRACG